MFRDQTGRPLTAAPEWFEKLCSDLYFRVDAEEFDAAARVELEEDDHGAGAVDGGGVAYDPQRYLPFDLLDESEYIRRPYRFPRPIFASEAETMLHVTEDVGTEYVCFCTAYAFADRRQLPTSVGTLPSRLWVNPAETTPTVYIQLSDYFPPAFWIPVKATAKAIRNVLAEFASMSSLHHEWHHDEFVARLEKAKQRMALQSLPCDDPSALRYLAAAAKDILPFQAPWREFHNYQEFFLGEFDDPEAFQEHLDLCPYLFAIPLMRHHVNLFEPDMTPTAEGPGVALSLYRCIYSKALLLVTVHLSAEVKLPPQDPEGFEFLWRDVKGELPKSHVPVFVRVMWPDNRAMSVGGALTQRFNARAGTEFADDTPIDAVLAVLYTSHWAGRSSDLLGVEGMRRRLDTLLEALSTEAQPKLPYPATKDIPSPHYTIAECVGMHVQYLAHLNDPAAADRVRQLKNTDFASVRFGCAKAALALGQRDLFREIVVAEPRGRMQEYMTKLVRKRKKRDLTEPAPRLVDEQYEFAPPLWTRKGKIDPSTVGGDLAVARLKANLRVQ